MVTRRRQAGYSLMEIMVAMTIFGVFLAILFILTAEMRAYQKRLPVNMMRHPQVSAVVSRLRRDVLDAYGKNPYHRTEFDGYTQSKKTLIVDTLDPDDWSSLTVVWDFSTPGEVKRREYRVGKATEWVARGLPEDFEHLEIDAVKIDAPYAVELVARDRKGRLAIDLIFQPRSEE